MLPLASPNCDSRQGATIDMLVLHYTGMPTAEAALARLCDPAAEVSAHYVIDRDGGLVALVPETLRAWHAGVSWWAGERAVNAHSIGIELVNPGHEFGYQAFPDVQIARLIDVAQGILSRHRIVERNVVGHSDVAPARKTDPGELFPWQRLAEAGIGLWPIPADTVAPASALARFGYGLPPHVETPLPTVIAAFQRRFRPDRIDGEWDDDCGRRLAGLLAFS